MSIEYCHNHDRHYDTDWEENCPVCEDETEYNESYLTEENYG